jgi:hypothetical protein
MLRTTSIFLAPNELRRDRRYAVPPLTVRVGEARFRTRNWSLGGFLLEGAAAFDIGARLKSQLLLQDRNDSVEVLAEALRRDERADTLACRFVDPSSAVVAALDHTVAARLSRRRQAGRVAVAVLGALVATAMPARAGDTGGLVPGAAPLPEFRLDFPALLLEPMGPPPGDLSISLNSPDKGVVHFLFSPRPQFGSVTDPQSGATRSYAGLTWNLFDNGGFFGNIGVAGSLTRPGAEELHDWRYFGPSLALHSTFELGYQLGSGHSLTLSLDRASEPSMLSDRYELDNFTLRYGLKF